MVSYRSARARLARLECAAGLHEKHFAVIRLDAWQAAEGEVERKQQEYLARHGLTREEIGLWVILRGRIALTDTRLGTDRRPSQ